MEAFLDVVDGDPKSYLALLAQVVPHPLFGRWIREHDGMGLIASICRLYVGQSFPLRLGAVVRTFSLDSSQVLQSSSIRSLSLFLSPFQPLSTATQAEIVKMGELLMIVYQSAMELPLELPSSPSVFPLPIALREQIQSRFIDNNEA